MMKISRSWGKSFREMFRVKLISLRSELSMPNEKKNESEKIFSEELEVLKKVKKTLGNEQLDPLALRIEYGVLAKHYEKLLKNAIRIATVGDKAQKKLLKYKELLDTLRNLD